MTLENEFTGSKLHFSCQLQNFKKRFSYRIKVAQWIYDILCQMQLVDLGHWVIQCKGVCTFVVAPKKKLRLSNWVNIYFLPCAKLQTKFKEIADRVANEKNSVNYILANPLRSKQN